MLVDRDSSAEKLNAAGSPQARDASTICGVAVPAGIAADAGRGALLLGLNAALRGRPRHPSGQGERTASCLYAGGHAPGLPSSFPLLCLALACPSYLAPPAPQADLDIVTPSALSVTERLLAEAEVITCVSQVRSGGGMHPTRPKVCVPQVKPEGRMCVCLCPVANARAGSICNGRPGLTLSHILPHPALTLPESTASCRSWSRCQSWVPLRSASTTSCYSTSCSAPWACPRR